VAEFSEEHEQLRRSVNRFVSEEINPHVDEWEAAGRFPAHELFRKMGKLGFLGVHKPEAWGGAGLDFRYMMVLGEELGTITCGALPMAIGVQVAMATPALAHFGSDELRAEFLAPSISGELVAAIGVSEAGAGSDVNSIRTFAKRDGDDYVIDGGKMWTTNGAQADWICLLANTSQDRGHLGKSLFCVPSNLPGFTVARTLDKLGMRSSDTAQIFLEGVRVPARYRIGEEGHGFVYQMQQFQEERIWGVISTFRAMEMLIDATINYTRERKVFGVSVLDNQVVHYRLAELQADIEAVRSLTYRACDQYIAGRDMTMLASMAKLKTGRLVREVADACLQYWGGMGFTSEAIVSRFYRDFRLLSIGGGADEVMLRIIAKRMGTLPKAGSHGSL
jgi:citronellyl-CoA dehydrogenase